MLASESVALDGLGFETVGVMPPGSLIILREGEEPIIHEISKVESHPCVFEQIYFARPDSMMEGGRVYGMRWSFGERLADEWASRGLNADVIVPVPDTSRPAAAAMSERLNVPMREGFIKNRYSGRTFIMPDQRTREAALRLKLNPIREVFEGKRVMLVDDSVVRGSTMRRIVNMIRSLNPAEVHLAIFSPPVRHPCFYGIDMPSREELVAAGRETADTLEPYLRERFQCDSVTYLSLDGLAAVAGEGVCNACFTGEYTVPVSAEERSFIKQDRRG